MKRIIRGFLMSILCLSLLWGMISCSFEAHVHNFDEVIVSKAATCAEEGELTYLCSCGESKVVKTAALGHDFIEHEAKAATCTEAGNAAYSTCSRCGYSTYKETPPIGHKDSDNWAIVNPATCTEIGEKTTNCIVCGEIIIAPIDALGHSWDSGAITSAATCTANGTRLFTCTRCGGTHEETIPALGHDYSTEWTVDTEPTCTAVGSKSHHCSRCDSKADITSIDALGHSYEYETLLEPTCTSTGSKRGICSICGDERLEEIPITHNLVANGDDTICSICGYSPESVYFIVENGAIIAIQNMDSLPSALIIPSKVGNSSISKIEEAVFYGCTNIESVIFSEGITNISNDSFTACSSLASVTFPDGLLRLGGSAFANTGLISVVLPTSVTTVDGGVFQRCPNLESITFSAFNNGEISSDLFWEDENLTEIVFRGTIAEWNALTKSEGWNDGVPATVVSCSDGNVNL